MNDAFRVSRIECVGNLDPERKDDLDLQRTPDNAVLQRHAIQKLHDDEGHSVLLVDLVDGADIRMIQSGGRFGLALKSAQSLRILSNVIGKELEGNEEI